VVAHRQHAVLQRDLDGPSAGSTCGRCRAGSRRRDDPLGLPADERRLEAQLEALVAAPAVRLTAARRPSSRRTHRPPRPGRRRARARPRRHERGQLVELLDDVGAQALLLVRRQPLGLAEDLDVRAQRGDRRAQLVAASAINWRCASTERSSASSVVLKLPPAAPARRALDVEPP
jgi:hypothetical protein